MGMSYIGAIQYSSTSHLWLLTIWNMTSVTKEINFKFYLILIILNFNNYMWLIVMVLDSTDLEIVLGKTEQRKYPAFWCFSGGRYVSIGIGVSKCVLGRL